MSSINNNTAKTYGSKKPSSSVFSGFSSFSSSFGFGRSAQSSFNDRQARPVVPDENDDWLSAFDSAPATSKNKGNATADQNNDRTDAKVLKETKADNRKRDGDEGVASTFRDIRRPKDTRSLLSQYTFDELERTLKVLDKGHQDFNKFLGTIMSFTLACFSYILIFLIGYGFLFVNCYFACTVPLHSAKLTVAARRQTAQLLEHELVGFKEVVYGENMVHETTIQVSFAILFSLESIK